MERLRRLAWPTLLLRNLRGPCLGAVVDGEGRLSTERGSDMRSTRRDGVVLLVSIALAFAPGVSVGQAESGSEQVTDGAKKVGEGAAETAKDAGKSVKEAGKKAGQTAGDVGDRLHDSAKGFGEALLGGIKHVGKTIIGFFED
jgi:hypothetical protein